MASYRLKAALAASIALHALLIVKAAPEAKVQIRHPAPALRASITAGPVSAESAARGAAGRAQRQIKRAPSSAPGRISGTATATPEHATTVDTQRNAPREPEVLEIAALDPRDYFRPLQVDEVAETMGTTAYMIDRADQLSPAWLAGKSRVGVTAGASAPEILVQDVIERLRELGAKNVRKLDGIAETVTFPLPKGLARASTSPALSPGRS